MADRREQVAVLTYHSMNISGNRYAENDHVALASDLETIDSLGMRVIPLGDVVDWHQGRRGWESVEGGVAITLDDGAWFDYHDLDHPTCGPQRSMFNILRDHADTSPRPGGIHATSFVIASPQARDSLDHSCMIGAGWWGDDWWPAAEHSGLMEIASHSWDHLHPQLETVAQREQLKGDFREVNTEADCRAQFEDSAAYISKVLGGKRPGFFAYPWGQASRYASGEYLPGRRSSHGYRAAFTIDDRHVTRADNRWLLPRYVCGRDWQSPAQLERILTAR